MNYNLLQYSKDVTADSVVITEPVTVQEVKDWLRLEGFIDDSDSLSTEFDDDDAIIEMLITSSRISLESFTGLSFVPKTIEAKITNLSGWFKLPGAPVNSITSVQTDSGTDITYTASGDSSIILTPLQADMVVTYEAGYTTLPDNLKAAMLAEIAHRYEHRGDEAEVSALCDVAVNIASKEKGVDTWLA